MNRREWKRAHKSVKRRVMEQSVQAVCTVLHILLIAVPRFVWRQFTDRVLAMSTERPHQQSEGIHEDGVADANQIFEDTDITVPDAIVQEDGPYNAEPMHLPTDHEDHEFEDGVPCIEPNPGSDDYYAIASLTKSTILDPSAIMPIHEDHVKEGGDHNNAGIEVAWKSEVFEESEGKWEVKAISGKHDQGKSVEAKIESRESTCARNSAQISAQS